MNFVTQSMVDVHFNRSISSPLYLEVLDHGKPWFLSPDVNKLSGVHYSHKKCLYLMKIFCRF
jgi:hypothetical protein